MLSVSGDRYGTNSPHQAQMYKKYVIHGIFFDKIRHLVTIENKKIYLRYEKKFTDYFAVRAFEFAGSFRGSENLFR